MSLIPILKELRRRWILVGAAVIVAAAISTLTIYQVSPLPPSISQRAEINAQGSIDILVDSAASPIADARRDLTGLIVRAGVFARLMGGGNVIGRIAQEVGVPARRIDVAGPAPLPGEAPGAERSPPQTHPYGIAITRQGELPILSVVTRAPTVAAARALAAAAPAAIGGVVEAIQRRQGTPAAKRVQFRVLGPAKAARVNNSPGKKVALVLFLVLLATFIALILGVPRFISAWRSAESQPPRPDSPQPDSGEHPAILVLPKER